jgi:hypothetical protein
MPDPGATGSSGFSRKGLPPLHADSALAVARPSKNRIMCLNLCFLSGFAAESAAR